MGNVGGVSERNNVYTDQEHEHLRGYEGDSTRAALNQIGRHAGLTENYRVRGDDKSERELHAEGRATLREALETVASKGLEELATHVLEKAAFVEVGLAALPLSLADDAFNALQHVAEDNRLGHEQAAALTKDKMHIFLLNNLNGLPAGYVAGEMKRYSEDEKTSNLVRGMNRALGRDGDHQAMLAVQLHCDQGMAAARAACDANRDPAAQLAANPGLAKRYAEDPAFKAGFDGLVWAKTKGGAETYEQAVTSLEARDARYDAAHVAWRV